MPEKDITLDIGVNSKEAIKAMNDFEQAAKKLSQILSNTSQPSKELQKTFSSIRKSASSYSSTLRKLQGDTSKYIAAVRRQKELEKDLELQQRDLANKKLDRDFLVSNNTKEIKELNSLIDKYKELNEVVRTWRKEKNDDNRKAASAAINDALEKGYLPKSMKDVGENIKNYKITEVDKLIEKQQQKVVKLESQIRKANLAYEKQANSVQKTSDKLDIQAGKVQEVTSALSEETPKLEETSEKFTQLVSQADAQNVFNNFRNTIKGIVGDFKRLLSTIKKVFSTLGKLTGISSLLKGLKSSLGGNNMELKDGIRYLIQYGFGFRSLYFLVRKLRSTFVDALEDMGKSVPQVQDSLDSLSKSMNTLRGGLAVAFAPLLKYVAALMESIAAVAIKAANAVAQFFAVITGQNVWFQMTDSVSGYTDAVKGSTKATKDNEKELKKQLAAFDDIDVLVKDLDEDTDNASGGGSGSGGSELGTWAQVANPVSELAELIKNAWASEDTLRAFEDVGRYIGNALQGTLDKLLTDFWPPLREKTEKVALAIAGTINGFFQTDAVVSFAKNIAAALNTALSTLSNYWNGVRWGNMGTKLRQSIEVLINDIEWNTLAKYLKGKLQGLIDLAFNTIGDGAWIYALGEKISGVLNHILSTVNFYELGSTINTFVVSSLNAVTKVLEDNEKGAVDAISQFLLGLNIDSIVGALARLVAELGKLAIKSGIEILKASNFLQGLLLSWIGLEIIKLSAKGLITKLITSRLTASISSAFTSAVTSETVTTAVTTGAEGLAINLGNSFLAGIPVIGLITGVIGVFDLVYSSLTTEAKTQVDDSFGFAAQGGLNSDATGFGFFWEWLFGKTAEESGEALGNSGTEVIKKGSEIIANEVQTQGKNVQNIVGTTESAILKDAKQWYTDLGIDLSGFTGTTLEELETYLGTISTNVGTTGDEVFKTTGKYSTKTAEAFLSGLATSDDGSATSLENVASNVSTAMNAVAQSVADSFNHSILPAYRDGFNEVLSMQEDFLNRFKAEAGGSVSFNSISASSTNSNLAALPRINNIARKNVSLINSPLMMAKGGVIPPNKPFLAMLGDQTKGTNVEAPLSTITEALQNALNSYGFNMNSGSQEIVLNIDGTTLARLTVPHNLKELNRQGYNVKVLERK